MDLWLKLTFLACCCWAMSDIFCDICIETKNKHNKYNKNKLTAEQNSIICGILSGIIGFGIIFIYEIQNYDINSILNGLIQFSAYRITLYAFELTSSTIITPLLQLSAVWMLPLSFVSSYFGYKPYTITTKDILAIMFIFIGGILPVSEGKLGVIFNKQFWNNKAVKYCIIAELMVSIYGLWVYQIHNDFIISPIIYFGLSRIGNFLMFCIFLITSKLYRNQFYILLKKKSMVYINISSIGVILSIIGLWLSTLSYGICREPSIVNATEGGLQQFLNLGFSLILKKMKCCKSLSNRNTLKGLIPKCISLLMISIGFILTL